MQFLLLKESVPKRSPPGGSHDLVSIVVFFESPPGPPPLQLTTHLRRCVSETFLPSLSTTEDKIATHEDDCSRAEEIQCIWFSGKIPSIFERSEVYWSTFLLQAADVNLFLICCLYSQKVVLGHFLIFILAD